MPIVWWPSIDGGINGAKVAYVENHYVKDCRPKGNLVCCIITDTGTAMSFASKGWRLWIQNSYSSKSPGQPLWNCAQIRYELQKLLVRGIVTKKRSKFYSCF